MEIIIKNACLISMSEKRNQIEDDNAMEQISFKEYMDPFTGAKSK